MEHQSDEIDSTQIIVAIDSTQLRLLKQLHLVNIDCCFIMSTLTFEVQTVLDLMGFHCSVYMPLELPST